MPCQSTLFTITKGFDNDFTFTIKANGSTLPITISATDTFSATLLNLADDSTVLTKPLSVVDAANGKVGLIFTANDTASLVADKGGKVDDYYLKPVYKLVLQCNTQANGNFLVTIGKVYVD